MSFRASRESISAGVLTTVAAVSSVEAVVSAEGVSEPHAGSEASNEACFRYTTTVYMVNK